MIRKIVMILFLSVLVSSAGAAPDSPYDIIEKHCTGCHTASFVLGHQKNRGEWEKTIDRMISYGTHLGKEERKIITDYLQQSKR
ncbi:MAG: cytochrome c [Nitrospirota bacterium]